MKDVHLDRGDPREFSKSDTGPEYIQQFIAAIARSGLTPPKTIVPDGEIHRFATNGKREDDGGWYSYHEGIIPWGVFGDWRSSDLKGSWRADIGRSLTPEEEAAHRAAREAAEREHKAEEAQRHAKAQKKAVKIWEAARPALDSHEYLKRKGVKSYGLRVIQTLRRDIPYSRLIIPVRDGAELHSLQYIPEEEGGKKIFLPGGRKKGCYFSIGTTMAADALCIAEGYATGASIHEATGYPVAVAFDAGNLLPVAKAIRDRFPDPRLILCADDDTKTPGNPGLTKAKEAALAVRGRVAVPDFGEARPAGATDFNDLHKHRGLEAVRACITKTVESGAKAQRNGGVVVTAPWANTLRVEAVSWIWKDWLAQGMLHVLAGAVGVGKSAIGARLAAIITTGGQWPDGTQAPGGDVLIWSGEDSTGVTLLPRFLAAGGNPARLRVVVDSNDNHGPRPFDLTTDLPALLAVAREMPNCKLVIIEPVVMAVTGDSHKNAEVRRGLQPLVELAEKTGAAVLGITHHSKGTKGRDPVERITGSLAFAALPRVTMAAAEIQEGGESRYVFCRTKSNIGPRNGGFAYALPLTDVNLTEAEGATSVIRVEFGVALNGSAKDLLAEADAAPLNKLDKAKVFLVDLLERGPVAQCEVEAAAEKGGFTLSTIRRAKKELKIVSEHDGVPGEKQKWFWKLPEEYDIC